MDLAKELDDAAQIELIEDSTLPDGRPRIVRFTAADALQPQAPLEWVVDRLITAGSVSVWYGEPGAKKTFALLSLSVCVALGKRWLDFEVPHPRMVLFVDEESGTSRLKLRLAAAVRGELGDENIPFECVSLAGFQLDKRQDQELLRALIIESEAELVIVDALSDVMSGDENSKKDVQPIFSALRRIAEETGAAIIIIHHSNKSGGYRGSSAIKGSLDLMIRIESESESSWISFRSEKSRDVEMQAWTAVATWTEDQFYLTPAETKKKERRSRPQSYVLRYLAEHGPSSMDDIKGAADTCAPSSARDAVYTLVEDGVVYRTNPEETGRGAVAIFALTKEEHAKEN